MRKQTMKHNGIAMVNRTPKLANGETLGSSSNGSERRMNGSPLDTLLYHRSGTFPGHHFRYEKGTGAEMCPAIIDGIVTGDTVVTYSGCKESHCYSLPFGQAEASIF